MTTDERVSRLMNPEPADLRAAADNPRMCWLPVFAKAGTMLADAIEMADSWATVHLIHHCVWVSTDGGVRWHDTRVFDERQRETVERAVRYLLARKLIERHEGQVHLVRFGGSRT